VHNGVEFLQDSHQPALDTAQRCDWNVDLAVRPAAAVRLAQSGRVQRGLDQERHGQGNDGKPRVRCRGGTQSTARVADCESRPSLKCFAGYAGHLCESIPSKPAP
jgi:hypothetical protein